MFSQIFLLFSLFFSIQYSYSGLYQKLNFKGPESLFEMSPEENEVNKQGRFVRSIESVDAECYYHGTYKFGICECGDTYFGPKCECDITNINNEDGCRPDNTTVDCSGVGTCICNICECNKRSNPEEVIYGKYCECDNFSCERNNNLLCSGPDHGVCECGECVCKPGWTGPSCDCRASNDACRPPNSYEICSGHGECECGVCKCTSTKEGRYSGKHCEKCPTCQGRCQEFKDCVQCQMYKTGPLVADIDCDRNCNDFVAIRVDRVTIEDDENEFICVFYDENDCRFTFKYAEPDYRIKVEAQAELECPAKYLMFESNEITWGIAGIVVVGLAILSLWKLCRRKS